MSDAKTIRAGVVILLPLVRSVMSLMMPPGVGVTGMTIVLAA